MENWRCECFCAFSKLFLLLEKHTDTQEQGTNYQTDELNIIPKQNISLPVKINIV